MGSEKHFKTSWILYVVVFGVFVDISLGYFDGEFLILGDSAKKKIAPYFHATMDAGGFSDWIWYGPSKEHPHPYHELLSGEWGAALYYDGINTKKIDPDLPARRAMWLTQKFEYPDWYTGNDFEISGPCVILHDPNNPTLPNPGHSFIANNEVEIQIDYEIVNLQYRDPNVWDPNDYLCRSPLGFLEPDEEDPNLLRSAYVYSDQYIFLQTYSITNLTEETLTNLAFYQLLHSHGADEYGPCVSSTYNPLGYDDPLEYYVPYNPVHCGADSNTVGNFRFDITQWNTYPCTGSQKATHKDWVGFSCAVEPDWIDNDLFRGGHTGGLFKVRKGTHINIENRALNGNDSLILDEVAGALGWALGALAPNETVKRTVAFMFCYGGKIPVRHGLYVKVSDDVGSCLDSTDPNVVITYTINYGNAAPDAAVEEDVVLTVTLPEETDRFSVQVSGSGTYSIFTNTATWAIGTLTVNDSGQESVSFKVVHPKAGGEVVGKAVLRNELNLAQYTRRTAVCRYDLGPIVYVDKFAPGNGEGSSWEDAFVDLQEALDYARTSGFEVEEIWVARGTYWPGVEDADCFEIPADVAVYGGFAGHVNPSETKESRNWRRNRTTLSGFVLSFPDGDGGEVVYRNNTVVKMGNNSLLDGVIVKESGDYGIFGNKVSYSVVNCIVRNNEKIGIYCMNGDLTVKWGEMEENSQQGIYHLGSGYVLMVENCKIHDNHYDGIYTNGSISHIFNSAINQNGSGSTYYTYYGINLVNPGNGTTIWNNTIVHNINEGINRAGGSLPTVKNNIVYYNNGNNAQIAGLSLEQVYYCCVPDCNEINSEHNVNDEPDFVYNQPPYGYYHIKYESPCRNSGDYGSYPDQMDMDGQPRVQENRVDIGADEVSCENTWHENDWTYDGAINYEEFSMLSRAWLSHDPNDPSLPSDPNLIDPSDFTGWNPICNLVQTGGSAYTIDLADLIAFCEADNWLWKACWRESYMAVWGGRSGGEGVLMMSMPMIKSAKAASVQTVYEPSRAEEKSITQQILDLEEAVKFLEKIWLDEPDIQETIDPGAWKDFIDTVYNNLYELQMQGTRVDLQR